MDLTNDCGMNEFYRDLIQQLPDIVYKINSRGEFIYINDSVERLGYKAQELIGKHFSTIFHLEDIPSIQHSGAVEKIRKSKERKKEVKLFDERRTGKRITKNLRVRLASKEGAETEKYFLQGEVFCSGVYEHDFSEHRAYVGTIGIIRDVSELSKTEKALTLAERHYRFLIENTSDIISILAVDGTILYKTISVERCLGYNHVEMIGENELDYLHTDDRPFLQALFTDPDLYRNREPYFEFRYLSKDRTWLHFEVSVVKVVDPDGSIMCYVVNSRNVTDRREKEQRLREKEEKFKALFNISSDAILVLTQDCRIADCNGSAGQMLGLHKNEMVDKNLEDLSLFTDNQSVQICLSGLHKKMTLSGLTCIRSDGFTFPADLTVIPVEKSGNRNFLLNIRDLSSRKKATEAQAKTKKIESLGILVGGIAQNFTGLLSPISEKASLARKNLKKTDPAYRLLNEIETAAAEACELTIKLMEISEENAPTKNIVQEKETDPDRTN